MRYKQDLAEFIPIADGARLVQERSGISEDEARADIVFAVRDDALKVRCWQTVRGERSWYCPDNRLYKFLTNLTPDRIDWENSTAQGGKLSFYLRAEIEVFRAGVCLLWPAAPERTSPTPNSKDRKTRRSEPQTDTAIKSRIKGVLLASNKKWPTTEKLPPTAYQAAKLLVAGQPGNRLYEYSDVTVRKILAGTYSPMSKHGLTGRY